MKPASAGSDPRHQAPATSSRVITRADYRRLATLKLAGRSDREIARLYRLPVEKISPHLRAALRAHREGGIKADLSEVVSLAEAKAVEDAAAISKAGAEAPEDSQPVLISALA